MDTLTKISESLQAGNVTEVSDLTRQALDEKLAVKTILDNGLIAGMTIVGQKFKAHQIFLPDVLMAAKAMTAGVEILRPLMLSQNVPTIGKIVIGTVRGDLHDIGKNLVSIMLRGAGIEVIDLGKDVPAERFLDEAEEHDAAVIGMSALLITTMPRMKEVIDLAKDRGVNDRFKFIVGGAPLSEEYAREIGADAYCFDGISAVERVKAFLGAS